MDDMNHKLLVMIAAGLLIPAGFALAQPTGETDDEAMNWEDAAHGLCTAYGASEEGRAHGNASHAPPFVWLQDQADDGNQSVSEYCDTVPHPRDAEDAGKPDDAGEPEESQRPDDAGKPDDAGDA